MPEIDAVLKKLKGIKGLPTLPEVVQNATAMLEDPKVTAKEVGDVITQDIAISAKVLKMVNSSFYGFQKTIDTISQAVVILGFNTLKNTILSVGIINALPKVDKKNQFNEYGFWLHSIATATASKTIAELIDYEDPERAFIAGLLHDLGKLTLALYFEKEMEKILRLVHKHDWSFLEAESRAKSSSHSLIGKWLVERWNLPDDLQQVVLHHHAPDKAEAWRDLAAMVCLGDILARSLEQGDLDDPIMPPLPEGTWEMLNMTADRIDRLMSVCQTRFEQATALLTIAR